MRRLLPALLSLALAGPAMSHEFWIEPLDYTVAPGARIEAKTINGEEFAGIEYGYSEGAFKRSGVIGGGQTNGVPGEMGQKPAFNVPTQGDGLHILYHASPVSTLTYANYTKFERFVKGKRLDWALEEHAALKLPTEDIRESYFRYVKALVAVGSGAGADRPVGMPYELVALDNPYTSGGDIRVAVLLGGEPAANVPVFVFVREGEAVEELKLTTGAEGQVSVPRRAGAEYMVNAVHIGLPGEQIKSVTKAHWQTLWAALTYRIE
ncbi:DUF4198 domain-containing protein [Oceanibium sediminis]|uniref:DUF4198 domain-containing protein n=1 Tax=Oceanibium sediminis TaxID=2026339 RepID=UPI000DD4019A|nr:DUF4198 domain-containing protein [Oceanibium sediminis]